MNGAHSFVALTLAVAAAGSPVAARAQDAPPITKLSVGRGGEEANGSSSAGPDAIYGDGRYVVFSSRASNLVSGDRTGLFLHDTVEGQTSHIAERASGGSGTPAVSADGRVLAYETLRSSCRRVVVVDRRSGARRLVPMARRNPRRPDLTATDFRLSPDGRYVVSITGRTGMGQSCAEAARDEERDEGPEAFALELFDRRTGALRRIRGRGLYPAAFSGVAVSRGARTVVVASTRTRWSALIDVVAIDTRTGRRTVVSVDSQERIPSPQRAQAPDITPDGRYVAFASLARLAAEDVGEAALQHDVYVRDLRRGTTTLVSTATDGSDLGASHGPSISTDGRYVAFASTLGIPNPDDVFVRDVAGASTRFVASGQAAAVADLAADGGLLVFMMHRREIDPRAGDRLEDVYMARLRP